MNRKHLLLVLSFVLWVVFPVRVQCGLASHPGIVADLDALPGLPLASGDYNDDGIQTWCRARARHHGTMSGGRNSRAR